MSGRQRPTVNMDNLWADVRYALRLLWRSPGFAVMVTVVLALGIGANSAVFSILDSTLIRPLPYPGAERLAFVWEDFSAFGAPRSRVSPATYLDWARRNQAFESLGAMRNSTMDLAEGGPPEELQGRAVSASLLPLLGVAPALGRTPTVEEERSAADVVVLSHGLWQRRFRGDPRVVGSTVVMSGRKFTVIGVMPQGFHFPDRQVEFWTPLGLSPQLAARRNSHFLTVVGRLKSGRGLEQAQSDMTAVARALEREFPDSNARVGITVVPLKDQLLGETKSSYVILLYAAALVLLIACANVANLLLARASGRQTEISVRVALGASRTRIVRQLLTESLLLAIAGGALGLLVARWSMSALEKMLPAGFVGAAELRVDGRVLLFACAISIATGILFGLAPALRMSGGGLAGRMGVRGTLGRRGHRLQDMLVALEVALAMALVAGAGLLIQTLVRMRAVDPGFRADRILTAEVAVPYPKYADRGTRARFYSGLVNRAQALPGVESVGLTSDLPFTSRGNTMGVSIESLRGQRDLGQDALFRLVSPAYLETIGARLLRGRLLNEHDTEASTPAVVVNEAFARQYFEGREALGQRVDTGTGDGQTLWMTIVGIVRDVRERGLDLPSKAAVYVPFAQAAISFFQPSQIAVRTARDPLSLVKELQAVVWSLDPEQPVTSVRTMHAIVDGELSNRQQVLTLLGTFAALALLLAALGVYGVLSYVVSRGRREIGLRMAIGATPREVARSVLGYSLRLTSVGLAVGLGVAVTSTRLLSTLLFGVSPVDWPTFAGVAGLLLSVGLIASYIPARRAARVDPMVALREE